MKIRKNSLIDLVNKVLIAVSFIALISCGGSKNIFLTLLVSLTTFLCCLTINEFVGGDRDEE